MLSRRALLLFLFALVVPVFAGACGSGDDSASAGDEPTDTTEAPDDGPGGAPSGPTVVAKGVAFSPAKVEIAAGESVTWRFADKSLAHNVVGDGFKSALKRSGTYVHEFDEPGTYSYRCTVHPGMKGTVVVS